MLLISGLTIGESTFRGPVEIYGLPHKPLYPGGTSRQRLVIEHAGGCVNIEDQILHVRTEESPK